MSDIPEGQPLATDPASATEQPQGDADSLNVLSSLRAMRGQLGSSAKPLDLTIPGYESLLVLRCKWVPYTDLAKGTQSLKKVEGDLQLTASCDVLVLACQEFLIRVDAELRPLAQVAGGDTNTPVTFGDPRLSDALGFPPADNARDACRRVFNNDYALIDTAESVFKWLQDTTRKVNEDFLGN